METQHKVYLVFMLMFFLLTGGTFGFMLIEDMDSLESFYMTVITISTVGFGEVQELSRQGKIYTIVLIFSALLIVAFTISVVSEVVIEGEFGHLMRGRKMEKAAAKLKDHYVVCGVGRTGSFIIDQLIGAGENYVAIDTDKDKIDHVIDKGGVGLVGDAKVAEDLLKAGIDRGKGLFCSLTSDADNVFTVLTARSINPNLYIVSRASDHNVAKQLFMAGVNNVVSPEEIGGIRMASMALSPSVVSFLDVVNYVGEAVYNIEELIIKEGSALDRVSLLDAELPKRTGVLVLGVKRGEKEIIINPNPLFELRHSDTLIVLAKKIQFDKLEELNK